MSCTCNSAGIGDIRSIPCYLSNEQKDCHCYDEGMHIQALLNDIELNRAFSPLILSVMVLIGILTRLHYTVSIKDLPLLNCTPPPPPLEDFELQLSMFACNTGLPSSACKEDTTMR